MSGEGSARRSTRQQNKQTDGTLQKIAEKESALTLTPEAKEIDMESVQASLEGISKQIGDMRKEMKSDMRALKDEITAQLDEKWATFSVEVNRKFDTIATGMEEQNTRLASALVRTEEMEQWSLEVNRTLAELLEERQRLANKLDDVIQRSKRNNIRVFQLTEEAMPAEGETMVQFMTDWLRKELAIDIDLGIQRAHRALGPRRKPDEPPRSVIINFQRFDVKEMVLAKAWAKTPPVKYGDRRVFFDHDYSDRVLEQRRSYDNIKRVLTTNKIKFNTPFTKIRIHWNTGKVMYQSAAEAAKDMRKRGLELGDEQPAEVEKSCGGGGESGGASGENATLLENLRAAKLSTWQRVDRRKHRTSEASRRARGKLQEYKR